MRTTRLVSLAASSLRYNTARSSMARQADNIVWIDCEMTGLNAYLPPADLPAGEAFLPDRILEIAVIVTDKDLTPLDDGVEYIVKTSKEVLDKMNAWCIDQHGKTGLTASCLASELSMAEVDDKVASYVASHFPEQFTMALLAGNSVHADRAFINKDLPKLAAMLHYRHLDVSSIKEIAKRWYPDVSHRLPPKSEAEHRALADIRASINELKHYRQFVFQPSPGAA